MNDKVRKYDGYRSYYPSMFDRFFDDDFFGNTGNTNLPAVNVSETPKEYKLDVSAPGFEKDDFDVKVENNMLRISASKDMSNEEKDENEKVIRQEFYSSTFSRSFRLPDHIDEDNIEAVEHNGILSITLPKKEKPAEGSSRKVSIR